MLDYAVKLTCDPASVSRADVERLRARGFSETAVLDICQITSYYAYVNRLADGLGVELEERWTETELTMDRAAFEARKGRGRG